MGTNVKTKTIKQSVIFNAKPQEIYELLMDSQKHTQFTDAPAKISRKVGGTFSCYGDYIEGKNLELIENEKVVQSWRGKDWPDGHYSTASFALKKVGQATKLEFLQTGVPIEQYDSINQGWKDFYWKKIKKFINV